MPYLFAVLFFLTPSAHAAEITELTYSTSVHQGQFLQVQFRGAGENRYLLSFRNKELPCYNQTDGGICCLAAVPADAEAGKEKAAIVRNGKTVSKFKVRILPTDFPVEPLTLTPEKKALTDKSDGPEEVQRIRAALATETPEGLWRGGFIRPVDGKIESLFGERRILEGQMRKGYHRGLDLGAPEGTPVVSANDGKVILAGSFTEEGNMVMIDHGQGIVSVYMHLSEIAVREGQTLKTGGRIGGVGTTGVTNTPNLHFGIYIHGTPIDPLFWLDHSSQ